MFGGWLAMLLFWLVFIALIVGTARYLFVNGRREGREREMSARELLDRAYARGEISREEYQRKREDLAQP